MFDLTAAELAILVDDRRLAALYWLLKLGPASRAVRPDWREALASQTTRLAALLRQADPLMPSPG